MHPSSSTVHTVCTCLPTCRVRWHSAPACLPACLLVPGNTMLPNLQLQQISHTHTLTNVAITETAMMQHTSRIHRLTTDTQPEPQHPHHRNQPTHPTETKLQAWQQRRKAGCSVRCTPSAAPAAMDTCACMPHCSIHAQRKVYSGQHHAAGKGGCCAAQLVGVHTERAHASSTAAALVRTAHHLL